MSTLGDLTAPKIDQTGPPPVGEFTYVDISSVDNSLKRIIEPKRLPVAVAPSRARQCLRAGDVLVSMTRPNLNAVAIVPPQLDGSVGSTGFHVLRALDGIEPRWLFYSVQTRDFVETMSSMVQGALYPAVRPKEIRAFGIEAPPLDEQRRTVAEIEKQFSRLDDAIANLRRLGSKADNHRNSVLTRVCHNEALRQPLGSLLREPLRNGHSAKAVPYGNGLPTFTLSAVTNGDFSDQNVKQTVANPNRVRDLWVKSGDIFVERSNTPELVGTARLYRGRDDQAIFPDLLIRVRVAAAVLPEWVELCLRSPPLRRYFKSRAQGIAGSMPKIDQDVVNEALIPVPPVAMQKELIAEVERYLSVIAKLEAQALTGLARAVRLRHAILARAFGAG